MLRKRLSKIAILFSLAFAATLVAFFPSGKADAATTGWQSISDIPGCQVRVWTDATNYYLGSTTVDTYIESSGCPRLYYSIGTLYGEGTSYQGTNPTGYFDYRSPTKSLYIKDIGIGYENPSEVYVYYSLWTSDGSQGGAVQSNPIYIYH